MIDSLDLQLIMPRAPAQRLKDYAPVLVEAMLEVQIDTVTRAAAFIAQLALESVELRYFEEIASGDAYEGRLSLGNTEPGDGRRYKGRGPLQITGRANYRAAGKALGLDLEGDPQLASDPSVGFRTAAWYWSSHSLNVLADACDFKAVTHVINGGYNGLAQRTAYYHSALEVLGRKTKLS